MSKNACTENVRDVQSSYYSSCPWVDTLLMEDRLLFSVESPFIKRHIDHHAWGLFPPPFCLQMSSLFISSSSSQKRAQERKKCWHSICFCQQYTGATHVRPPLTLETHSCTNLLRAISGCELWPLNCCPMTQAAELREWRPLSMNYVFIVVDG
jgi:hypothetical protein